MAFVESLGDIDWGNALAAYGTYALLAVVGFAIGWGAAALSGIGSGLGYLGVLVASALLPVVLHAMFPIFGMTLCAPLFGTRCGSETGRAVFNGFIMLHFSMWMAVLLSEKKEDYFGYGSDGRPLGRRSGSTWRALRLSLVFLASTAIYGFAKHLFDTRL